MTALMTKLCGAVALGSIAFWGSTLAPSHPIDQLDAERARRRLEQEGYEDVRLRDIDRWFTHARHECPREQTVAVQVWARDPYGTIFNLTVCCDEAMDHKTCSIVRAKP